MAPRQIAVTGATGFTGPFVVRALRARFPGATIRCLVRPASDLTRLDAPGLETRQGDLRDVASLRALFDGADTLVNVASLGFDWIDPLFEAVRGSRLSRGVFIGTTAMLTALPVKSRAIRERGETLARESGVAWTILRPTMIYGTPRDRNIARLIRFVLRSPVVPLPAPRALQQPVHVDDVAAAVRDALASHVTEGRAYNIAGRDPLPLADMVKTIAGAAGVRRLVVPIAPWLARGGAAACTLLRGRPIVSREQIDRLYEHKNFSYEEAARDFGYAPRTFEAGVRDELRMIREEQGW